MPQRSWPLSQDANKNSGVCSGCRAVRQLHLKDGKVHRHGPRDNPCPGSNKLPLSVSSNLPCTTGPSPQSQPQSQPSNASTASRSPSIHGPTTNPAPFSSWHPVQQPLIKHAPKSARPACAWHLAKILNPLRPCSHASVNGSRALTTGAARPSNINLYLYSLACSTQHVPALSALSE